MSIFKRLKPASLLLATLINTPVWSANEANSQATAEKTARTEVYGEPYAASHLVKEGQRRLVVYRMAKDGSDKEVLTVFVNKQYQASLRPAAFTKLCATLDAFELAAVQRSVGQKPKAAGTSVPTRTELAGLQTRYFRVSAAPVNGGHLTEVPAEQANAELAGTREAIHTLSRVTASQNCEEAPGLNAAPKEAPKAPVVVPVVEPKPAAPAKTVMRFNFAADTLFAFGKSTRASMPLNGLRALDELEVKLRQQYKGITEVRVIGYADPIGNDLSNMRLSQQRADEVKNYLRSIGLTYVPIQSEGRGATELVATQCGRTPTPLAIQCHQPNRRVVIEVTGAQEVTTTK